MSPFLRLAWIRLYFINGVHSLLSGHPGARHGAFAPQLELLSAALEVFQVLPPSSAQLLSSFLFFGVCPAPLARSFRFSSWPDVFLRLRTFQICFSLCKLCRSPLFHFLATLPILVTGPQWPPLLFPLLSLPSIHVNSFHKYSSAFTGVHVSSCVLMGLHGPSRALACLHVISFVFCFLRHIGLSIF